MSWIQVTQKLHIHCVLERMQQCDAVYVWFSVHAYIGNICIFPLHVKEIETKDRQKILGRLYYANLNQLSIYVRISKSSYYLIRAASMYIYIYIYPIKHPKTLRIKRSVIQPQAPPTHAPHPAPHQIHSMQLKFNSPMTNLDPTPAPPPISHSPSKFCTWCYPTS